MLQFLKSDQLRSVSHNALRIVAGLAFMTHGGQKLFGWFGAEAPHVAPFEFLVAGILEFFGGLAVALGVFTSPIAFVLAGEMAVTYFWKHAAGGDTFSIWWWTNRGELPMLYCFIWLLFAFHGAGRFSLDHWLKQRREAPITASVAGPPTA